MKSSRSRWWLAGAVVAGVAGTAAGLALLVRKAFAPDLDDESLFDAPPTPAVEMAGAATHPSAGSGTGWPEPQHTPEHTELPAEGAHSSASVAAGSAGSAGSEAPAMPIIADPAPVQPFAPPPAPPEAPLAAAELPAPERMPELPEPPAAPAPERMSEPPAPTAVPEPVVAQSGRETGRLSAETASAVQADEGEEDTSDDDMLDRTLQMPPGQAAVSPRTAAAYAGHDPVSPQEAMPGLPSDPAVRPETPFSEQQAEMNLRLQEHLDELLNAFPGITVHDIVTCDGELERLVDALVPKAGMERGAVIERLQAILHVGAAEATNPGALDVAQPRPETIGDTDKKPESHV